MLVIPNEFIDCWSHCHHLQQKPWWQEVESWTSKCCYSKFQMNLIIPFCDILSKAFLYWNFLCGIQTHEQRYLSFLAVLLESWAISILLQSVEHLGLEELEVILWTKGTVKGQTINKKVRNWKEKLNFFITSSWPESCFLPLLPHPQTSMTSFYFLLAKVAAELLIGLNVS